MIPGSNILNQAFSVIAQQTVTYYRCTGRTLNSVGQYVTSYAFGIPLKGSFQPVPRSLYQAFGLDLQKSYYVFYASTDILDIDRNVSADQIAFSDQRYQCESDTAWFNIDGWKGVICVHIGPDTGDLELFGFGQLPPINTYQNFGNGNFYVEPE